MNFDEVNSIGVCEGKPILKISEMVPEQPYPVLKMGSGVHKTYGRNIFVETAKEKIYLPKRMVEKITDEEIAKFNSCSSIRYSLVFIGTLNTGHANDANLVKFVQQP